MYIIIFGIEGLLWKVYIYVYMEIFVISVFFRKIFFDIMLEKFKNNI